MWATDWPHPNKFDRTPDDGDLVDTFGGWVSDPDGVARDESGVKGRGASYGLQFALGGMLLLDSLDRTAAVEMDNTTGVNNSYFFLEWYLSNLDCFGGDCMQVGTSTWMLGLALEI